MSTVAFIARDALGTNQHGTSAEGSPSIIPTTGAKDISLNLDPTDVESYARRGRDLHVTLADGTVVELDGFYDTASTGPKNLFLSDEGDFIEVVLEDKSEGMLFASYEPLDLSGKWSAYDDMVFLDVDRIEPVVAPLAAPLLGGLGGVGAAAAGAAVIAGVGGGGGGGGGDGDGGDGGTDTIVPTVNDADGTYDVPEGDPDGVTISGTGEAGSDVEVTIGDVVVTTTVEDDGTWSVNVPTDDLPDDGVYETVVDVVAPDGTTYEDLDGPTIDIDSEPPTVIITEGTQSVGDIVDGDEQASGTIITGTGEAGATVSLEINGATQTTTVAEDGTWSVTFTSDEIETGEYETGITITTTDPHGNSTTTTDVLEVDTETAVTIDSGLSGGDDIVTAAEAAAGVAITGTAEAGATVEVTIEGVTRTTTAASDGTWTVTYPSGTVFDTEGEYDREITVTSTDTAGNTATATSTIAVDTDAGFVQLDDDPIETDDIINAAERADGVTITGTATAGETVTVTLGDASGTTVADADGNWSYDFDASEIDEGTDTLDVTASISDDLGNTETDSDTVALDTEVVNYGSETLQTSDDVVNIDELATGFTLAGTVEEGSTVSVEIDGTTYPASVDDDGNWSLTLDGDDLGTDSRDVTATISATDPAGNVETITQDFSIDTDVDTPDFDGVTIRSGEISDIYLNPTDDDLSLFSLDGSGNATEAGFTEFNSAAEVQLDLDQPLADGTNLVIQGTDDAGNRSSVLVIDQQSVSSDLLNSVGEHNIDTLDLVFEDSGNGANVTLTEEMINNLSSNSDTLVVRGDDNVGPSEGGTSHTITLTGGTADGTRDVDGETFNVYTIGDGDTTLLVEDDVNVII
ncbi:Ig-like domain-containing protein [Epibacterium sp. MM17-32]|uniref:Ig-like domain-containing protein n=1 Tax=Epibacterium sp. MM17-32 TaxID=2917734 RepID=UPI001EF6EC33|nr:Ig-like domain-containing protein [Epibacterium sp. MM17-32]MCG7629077.1 Ig-like domain-containing protein [Epibacterium sp. MM17-32]